MPEDLEGKLKLRKASQVVKVARRKKSEKFRDAMVSQEPVSNSQALNGQALNGELVKRFVMKDILAFPELPSLDLTIVRCGHRRKSESV